MHAKQAIPVCCLANRFHLRHALDADIHEGKKKNIYQGSQRRLVLQNCKYCVSYSVFVLCLSTGTHKFVTEGEHVELKAITKEQSGSYECIASNDISNPDVRTVEVTVNCEGQKKKKGGGGHFFRKQIGHNDRVTPKKNLAQTNEKAEFYIIFVCVWDAA